MSAFFFLRNRVVALPATAHTVVAGSARTLSVQRLPTDAYFYADVLIHNAVTGSRYLLVDSDNPSTVLSTGVISSNPEVLPNIPSFGSPMVMRLTLRKATSSPYYKSYKALIPHKAVGSDFYVAQELDQ